MVPKIIIYILLVCMHCDKSIKSFNTQDLSYIFYHYIDIVTTNILSLTIVNPTLLLRSSIFKVVCSNREDTLLSFLPIVNYFPSNLV